MYGTFSGFHTFLGGEGIRVEPGRFDPTGVPMAVLKSQPKSLSHKLRLALLANGVDVNGRIGGFLSATHSRADADETAEYFRSAIGMLRAEGEIA